MTQKTKTANTTKAKTVKKTEKSLTKAQLEKRLARDERQLEKDKKLIAESQSRLVSATMGEDFRNSILIVSLLINLFVFITWIVLQVTTQYDAEVAMFLFAR